MRAKAGPIIEVFLVLIIFAYIEFPLSVVTIVDEALAEKFPIYESGHWGVAKYKVTALQVLFFVEYICILRPLLIGLQKQDSCGVFVRPRAAALFALLCSVALVFIAAGWCIGEVQPVPSALSLVIV